MTLLNPISRLFKKGQPPSEEVSASLVQGLNSAYSHPGLEEIYTLETIDPRTIRRIQTTPAPEAPPETFGSITVSPLSQLELPLGDEFISTIESFVLNEPIQVLKLAPMAEQRLKENDIFRIRDLVDADWGKLLFVKGLGQGHIDDVRDRLRLYLQGKSLYATQNIDFEAWIRSLLPDDFRKQISVLLEAFGLTNLVTLTPAEQAEARRLSTEHRQQWVGEAKAAFLVNASAFNESMQKVVNTFVKPWMRSRQGVAHEFELMDRLHQVAENESLIDPALAFFSSTFCNGNALLPQYLVEITPHLFCVDPTTAEQYNQVTKAAKTYFYKNSIVYSLDELTAYIEREWAREWGSIDTAFIVKAIRSSPSFSVRKGPSGNLLVTLQHRV